MKWGSHKDSENGLTGKAKSTETFQSIEQQDQLKSLFISTLLQLKNQVENHQNLKNSEKFFKNIWGSYYINIHCLLDVCNENLEVGVSMWSRHSVL